MAGFFLIKHHWHEKHQDVLVGVLVVDWGDDSGAVRCRHLKLNLSLAEVCKHLLEELRAEADFHVFTCVVASEAFLSFVRVIEIFGCENQFLTTDLETNLVCCLA